MKESMQHYADLLMPLVRTLEQEILTPVYPEAHASTRVVEGWLCVFVMLSEKPLLATSFELANPEQLEGEIWKSMVKPLIVKKFTEIAAKDVRKEYAKVISRTNSRRTPQDRSGH